MRNTLKMMHNLKKTAKNKIICFNLVRQKFEDDRFKSGGINGGSLQILCVSVPSDYFLDSYKMLFDKVFFL